MRSKRGVSFSIGECLALIYGETLTAGENDVESDAAYASVPESVENIAGATPVRDAPNVSVATPVRDAAKLRRGFAPSRDT